MTKTSILILVPVYSAYDRHVIEGATKFARNHPDQIEVYVWDDWHTHNGPQYRLLAKAVEDMQRFGIDGILANIWTRKALDGLKQLGLPLIDYGGTWPVDEVVSVHVDNRAVGKLAAQHLLEKGFRHFAFWGKDSQPRHACEREEGFVSEIRSAGFECSTFYRQIPIVPCSQRTERPARKWLLSLPKPVGLMCWFDWQGVVAQYVCRVAGLSVPDQVAMIGVDNDDMWQLQCIEPLTSIETNPHTIGHDAMKRLVHMIRTGDKPSEPLLIPPGSVVTKRSTDFTMIKDAVMAQALRFIRESADRPISVQDVLRAVPMSRRHLEIQCRRILRRSPREHIQWIHLERSKMLLKRYDLSISQIAAMSGFTNTASFTRLFNRVVGCSPRDYRKKIRS